MEISDYITSFPWTKARLILMGRESPDTFLRDHFTPLFWSRVFDFPHFLRLQVFDFPIYTGLLDFPQFLGYRYFTFRSFLVAGIWLLSVFTVFGFPLFLRPYLCFLYYLVRGIWLSSLFGRRYLAFLSFYGPRYLTILYFFCYRDLVFPSIRSQVIDFSLYLLLQVLCFLYFLVRGIWLSSRFTFTGFWLSSLFTIIGTWLTSIFLVTVFGHRYLCFLSLYSHKYLTFLSFLYLFFRSQVFGFPLPWSQVFNFPLFWLQVFDLPFVFGYRQGLDLHPFLVTGIWLSSLFTYLCIVALW